MLQMWGIATRALRAASLAIILVIGSAHAETFLGFRLLDLEGANVRWDGNGGKSAVVKYALLTEAETFPNARNCQAMTPVDGLLARSSIDSEAYRREVRAAFDMWQGVASIVFEETTNRREAGILIGAQRHPVGYAFADVKYKAVQARPRPIERSLICLNPTKRWKIGFDGNLDVYDLRYTIAHEIGHAIGLDHPAPSGQLMGWRYEENFRTLQAGDVGGVVRLYGARVTSAK